MFYIKYLIWCTANEVLKTANENLFFLEFHVILEDTKKIENVPY